MIERRDTETPVKYRKLTGGLHGNILSFCQRPVRQPSRQTARREEVTAMVEQRLDPVSRAIFRKLLQRAQYVMRLRDNGQHYLVKLVLPIRRMYAELARRWAERGWLAAGGTMVWECASTAIPPAPTIQPTASASGAHSWCT